MENKRKFKHALKFIPGVIAVFAAFTAITMWLWNALLPEILNLPTINFWQALGLMVLSRLLFGGFRPNRFGGPRRNHMDRNFKKKWGTLTPEERKAFIAKRYFADADNGTDKTEVNN